MDLSEVRVTINEIDSELTGLLNRRYECSKKVAEAKLEANDEIFKPVREGELCEKFEAASGVKGKNNIKSIVINSRILQYGMFYDIGKADDFLKSKLDQNQLNALSEGGLLELNLKADPKGEKALTARDIMYVLTQTELDLEKVYLHGDAVEVSMNVSNDEKSKKHASIITYMLMKETL